MIEFLKKIDADLLITLNNFHHPLLDPVMYWFSDKYIWFPLYAFFIGFLLYKFRLRGLHMILALALTVAACDQLTSSFMKPFFARLRPCHDPAIQDYLRMITGCGGKYGFASSHASNAFGFAVLVILLMKNKFSWVWWLLPWAVLVSYSRVYLGVHYPGDIIAGGIAGSLLAFIFYFSYQKLTGNEERLLQKNV